MTAERDALAEVLAGWHLEVVGQVSPNDALSIAEGILASDWLAEHDVRIAEVAYLDGYEKGLLAPQSKWMRAKADELAGAREAALEEAALAIEAKRGLLHEALAEVKRGYSNAAHIVRSLGADA